MFYDSEIPLDETFTSFDIPMDLITKRTGHVIKIYSTTQNNWESIVYHEDDHVRMILTLYPNTV